MGCDMEKAIYHPPTYFDNRYEDEFSGTYLSVKRGSEKRNHWDIARRKNKEYNLIGDRRETQSSSYGG